MSIYRNPTLNLSNGQLAFGMNAWVSSNGTCSQGVWGSARVNWALFGPSFTPSRWGMHVVRTYWAINLDEDLSATGTLTASYLRAGADCGISLDMTLVDLTTGFRWELYPQAAYTNGSSLLLTANGTVWSNHTLNASLTLPLFGALTKGDAYQFQAGGTFGIDVSSSLTGFSHVSASLRTSPGHPTIFGGFAIR